MKRVTPLCTLVGAVPGAIPPMMGWAAATGSLGREAWALFAVLFLWQLPHFLAIAWIYRDDYARGGFPMLPVTDPGGDSTARQSVAYASALVPVTLLAGVAGDRLPWAPSRGAIFVGCAGVFAVRAFLRGPVAVNRVRFYPAVLGSWCRP